MCPNPSLNQASAQSLQADVHALKQRLVQQKQLLNAQRSEDFGFEWEPLNDSVALLHDPLQRNGWRYTGYVGCRTKRNAEKVLRQLQKRSPQTQYHLRKARRLPSHRWEIKATDIAPALLENLASQGRHHDPVRSA